MGSTLYRHYKKMALSGAINLITDNIYCMLVSGNHDPSLSTYLTHRITGDLTNKEVVGQGYLRGGVLLSSKVVGEGSPAQTAEAYFDAADVSWSNSTITASGAILWRSGSASHLDAHVIAWIDFGADQPSSNGLFSIQWNSEGIINWN